MEFKLGDKVRLLPQDDQYIWVDGAGKSLTDRIGEITTAYGEYGSVQIGHFKGYGVTFIDAAPNHYGDCEWCIEGRHLIKVDDDDWLDANPYMITKWSADDVWTPYKNHV